MAELKPKTPPGPKVSPVRTVVSIVLLLIVGAICVIELRAGFGQMMTGKAMAAKDVSEDGAFINVTLETAKGMLSLAPSESVQRDTPTETVYRYEWFSLLRPLIGESSPQLFLVASKSATPMALGFHTSAEEDPVFVPSTDNAPASDMSGMGGPGGGMGMGMGGPGGGMGMGGGRGPGGGPGGRGNGQRPAVEGDGTETPSTEQPAETPAPAKEGDAPATPDPATPDPATPDPATPEPATPEPATPEPATPEPATPEPATPEPATPEPATPEPATPEPATPADPAAPASPEPPASDPPAPVNP